MWCAAGSAYGHSCMLCMVSFCENLTLISNGGIEFNRKNNIQQEQVLAEHPQISYRHVNNLYIYIYLYRYDNIYVYTMHSIYNHLQQQHSTAWQVTWRSRGVAVSAWGPTWDRQVMIKPPWTWYIYDIQHYIYTHIYIIIWYMYNLIYIYIYLLYIHYTYH